MFSWLIKGDWPLARSTRRHSSGTISRKTSDPLIAAHASVASDASAATDTPSTTDTPVSTDAPAMAKRPKTKDTRVCTKAPTFSEVDETSVPPNPVDQQWSDGDVFVARHWHSPSGNIIETETRIDLAHEGLAAAMRFRFPSNNRLNATVPRLNSKDIFVAKSLFEQDYEFYSNDEHGTSGTAPALRVLLDYLYGYYAQVEEKRNALPAGRIVWHLLWWIFPSGLEVEGCHPVTGHPTAYIVDRWDQHRRRGDFPGRFVIYGHYYQWSGTTFEKRSTSWTINEFSDVRDIEHLPVKPLSEEQKKSLHDRGRIYAEQYAGRVNAEYKGSVFSPYGERQEGSGRVMIDVASFRRVNPQNDNFRDDIYEEDDNDYDDYDEIDSGGPQNSTSKPTLPSEFYFLLPPSIHGFSLKSKRWGEFLIANLRPIQWSNAAFDHLVIPSIYRTVVQSLVDVHTGKLSKQLVTDVVPDKGEGVIIALHGRPGTGKTLTAEAVSEHLRRPLYMVSAGELGITVKDLENKLNEVLELATTWKAVLLIDEADIFLTKRSTTDIERNALVGVFLRLLEYYNGVLVLTTNRVAELDDAFASRFSLSLNFQDLDQASRKVLWKKFICLCAPDIQAEKALEPFDVDELSESEVNGRIIKQTVRTAHALALCEGETLSMEHLRQVLSFMV